MKSALIFVGIGFEIISMILASYYIAPSVEVWLPAIKGYGFVVLSLACLVGWLVHVIVLLKKLDKDIGSD